MPQSYGMVWVRTGPRYWYLLSLLGASLILAGCFGGESGAPQVEITHSDQIADSYRAEGTNPPDNQTKYMGDVVVSGQTDTSVNVSWSILGDQWTGIGTINNEGELFVTYTGAFTGSGTWILRTDGNLYGTWEQAGFDGTGTEVWHRNSP